MRARLGEERATGIAMLAPAIAAIALVAFLPIAAVFWMSLERRMPVFGIERFVGLENYAYLLRDPGFLRALGNTVYITALAVPLELGLGLATALLLHRRFPGRAWVRAAVLVPWAIPTVVSARMWEWILNPAGVLNHLLGADVNWLGDPAVAIHAVILADVWKTTPFAALLLLAGLQVIPEDLPRAARVDGAGPFRVFWHVTLPLLRPALLVALLFRTLDTFRVFDVVYALTEGGPADRTATLSLYAYRLYFRTQQFGTGSAVSVLTFACVLVLAVLYVRLLVGRRGR